MIDTAVYLDEETSIMEEVSVEEVRQAIAVGKDGLKIEMITAAGEQAFQRLVIIMIEAYRTETVPLNCQKAVINPIYIQKKGKRLCVSTTEELCCCPMLEKYTVKLLKED